MLAIGLIVCPFIICAQAELKSAQDTVSILEMMLALSQTQCLLQEHRLDQPKYLDMWGPELIMQLYADILLTRRQEKVCMYV